MTRKDALDAMTRTVPASRRVPARRDALRALMYAEATGLATGQGYRVEYKPRDGYTVTLGKDA